MPKKNTPQFTHLHLHSEYSMLDGMIRFNELMPHLKELGMNAVAMTDHGVMHGALQFHNAAKANDIKQIMGVEAYVAPDHTVKEGGMRKDSGEKAYFHLTILAKNKTGYHNLVKLVSIANTDGFYYKPRIDFELLKQYHEGLIILSGCYGGELAQTFFTHHHDEEKALAEAKKLVKQYQEVFDEDYYLEIQRGTSDQASQDQVDHLYLKLAKRLNMPLVATTDAHYLYKKDAEIQDILWAVTEGKTIYDPGHREMVSRELYIKSPEEMLEMFKDIPEAVAMTQEIVDKVEEYEITYDRIQPQYPDLPKDETAQEHLRKVAYEGLKERYEEITNELTDKLDYELEVIHNKGYDDYFLVVSDFTQWARDRGILANPRGSGPGSLVAYVTGISDIDPVRWRLSFDRFLNPERPSPPDFDIDFPDDRRQEVIDYVTEKYGEECVAGIAAIGRMKTKAAIRDVSRALGIELAVADRVAKLIPVKYGKPMPIKEAMEQISELAEMIDGDPKMEQMVEAVDRLNGTARHLSVHACGYLITPDPITNYLPLARAPKNEGVVTQLEGPAIEELGMMKFDFLGLKNWSLITNTLAMIEQVKGEKLDVNELPEDDKNVFRLFQLALTDNVFQLESQGMKKYLRDLVPDSLDDIVFMVSAYRPGPMEYIPGYIDCKHGRKDPEYLHEDLIPILKDTYGYAIYQEQILEIAVKMAGYSMGGADILRRAISKKKEDILKKEKVVFRDGMVKNGYTKELAAALWKYLEPFANYGFNKSHSVCYAYVSYYTAYFKTYYPLEFVSAVFKADLANADDLHKDIKMAVDMGIDILPPDINESKFSFSAKTYDDVDATKWVEMHESGELKKKKIGAVRFGLGGIKNVSEKAVKEIVAKREEGPYKHLDDLLNRVDLSQVDKKTLLHLAMVGAFDSWEDEYNGGGEHGKGDLRTAFIEIIPELFDRYKASKQNEASGQKSLFAAVNGGGEDKPEQQFIARTKLPSVPVATVAQKAEWERELLGVLLSEHPLGKISGFLEKHQAVPIEQVIEQQPTKPVVLGVQFNGIRRIQTKKGDPMAFIDINDLSGSIDGVIFPSDFEKLNGQLNDLHEGEILLLRGKYNQRGPDQHSFIVNQLKKINWEEAVSVKSEQPQLDSSSGYVQEAGLNDKITIVLNDTPNKNHLQALKEKMHQNPGPTTVFIKFKRNGAEQRMKFNGKVSLNLEVQHAIRLVGEIDTAT